MRRLFLRRPIIFASSLPTLSLILVFFFPFVPGPGVANLSAQKVYTLLKDEKKVKTFTEVSNGIICKCGCNFVLSACPHIECGFAIPIRRFIENRIHEGMTAREIIQKMEKGFGPEIKRDPIVQGFLANPVRQGYGNALIRGFGPKINARTSPLAMSMLVLVSFLVFYILFKYWRDRKTKHASGGTPPPGQASSSREADSSSPELDAALQRLKDLEK